MQVAIPDFLDGEWRQTDDGIYCKACRQTFSQAVSFVMHYHEKHCVETPHMIDINSRHCNCW